MASIKTNIDFFKLLLAESAITTGQRTELLDLMSVYLQEELEFKEDIDQIILKLREYENLEKNEKLKEKDEFKFHDPRLIVALLSEFTNDNYPVKWLVHAVDRSEYRTYNDIIDPVKDRSNYQRWVRLLDYDKDLWWDVIFPFIFQTRLNKDKEGNEIPFGWGRNNIKIGWQYPEEIKVWCETNMDDKSPEERRYPFEMSLPRNVDFPRGVRTFEDVVREFNKEIRYERNTLSLEIDQLGEEVLKQHNLINNIEGITKLYVHTWNVRKALHRIFGMIHWRTENNEVIVSNEFNEDRSMMWLKITHVNSNSPSAPSDSALNGSYGDLREIIIRLRNVCDFSIEGNFMDPTPNGYQPYRISYLYPDMIPDDNEKVIPKIERLDIESEVMGFTYLLGFYLLKS